MEAESQSDPFTVLWAEVARRHRAHNYVAGQEQPEYAPSYMQHHFTRWAAVPSLDSLLADRWARGYLPFYDEPAPNYFSALGEPPSFEP